MKTFTLFVIALAILAVTLAAGPTTPGKKNSTTAKSPSRTESQKARITKNGAKQPGGEDTSVDEEPREKANDGKVEAQAPKPKEKRKEEKEDENNKEDKVDDNFDDVDGLLGEDEDEDGDEDEEEQEKVKISIPPPKSINFNKNPIELGQQIADPKFKGYLKEHIEELKDLIRKNSRTTTAGKFYRAALAAVSDSERATDYWVKEVEKQAKKSKNLIRRGSKNLIGGPQNFIGDIGNGIKRIAEADLPGTFKEGAYALGTGILADGAKNFSNASDLFHDGLENGHALIETLGEGVKHIPLVGPLISPIYTPIKRNIDQSIKNDIARGRFFGGRNGEELSRTYSTLQQNAIENYKDKTRKLKSALSRRQENEDDYD